MIQLLNTRYGAMFVPDTDNAQYPWLESAGICAEHQYIITVQDLLAERERGTFVDVGASFGCWSLALAPHADRVIAIEPQPEINQLMRCTITENSLRSKVLTCRCAAGAQHGTVDVAVLDLNTPSNFGGLSLGRSLIEQPHVPMEQIRVIPLDMLIGSDEAVSFIKIDVEGAEPDVIVGADKLIRRCRPLMFIEAFHSLTDTPKLQAQIEALGYATQQRGPNFLCLPI